MTKFSKAVMDAISIHALLAESDWEIGYRQPSLIVFLSTLSLRRATPPRGFCRFPAANFYPRSPCGERLKRIPSAHPTQGFLSTLSLRRAT